MTVLPTVFCRSRPVPGLVVIGLLLPMTAALAAPEPNPSLDDRVELSGRSLAERVQAQPAARYTVTQRVTQPLATAGPSGAAANWRGQTDTVRQTMLWAQPWSNRGLRLGVGVEQRERVIGGGPNQGPYQNLRPGSGGDAGVLVGMAMPTGARSHVFLQTPLLESSGMSYDELGQLAGRDQPRQVRVGMTFNSSKPYKDLTKGFKMELSGQSSLTFRPRGGKVGVSFQKIW